MFTRIQSTGIGPHTDLDLALSPTGRTVIRGHSEHGKSVLIDAILLVLYGVTRGGEPFDAAQMSADRVSITLTSATGREFGYQRKTSPRWAYAYQGETLSQTSAKGWIDALSMAAFRSGLAALSAGTRSPSVSSRWPGPGTPCRARRSRANSAT